MSQTNDTNTTQNINQEIPKLDRDLLKENQDILINQHNPAFIDINFIDENNYIKNCLNQNNNIEIKLNPNSIESQNNPNNQKKEISEIGNNNLGFINPEYYDEFNRPKYEELVNYENSLREEVESKYPLISELLDVELLHAEYLGSMYEKAICDFSKKIKKWRTVRRDGNCFYRSFLFRLFEQFILNRNSTLHKNIIKIVEDGKSLCIENGYSWLVLEDFYNVFYFLLKFYFYFFLNISFNYLEFYFRMEIYRRNRKRGINKLFVKFKLK